MVASVVSTEAPTRASVMVVAASWNSVAAMKSRCADGLAKGNARCDAIEHALQQGQRLARAVAFLRRHGFRGECPFALDLQPPDETGGEQGAITVAALPTRWRATNLRARYKGVSAAALIGKPRR